LFVKYQSVSAGS